MSGIAIVKRYPENLGLCRRCTHCIRKQYVKDTKSEEEFKKIYEDDEDDYDSDDYDWPPSEPDGAPQDSDDN